MNHQIEQLKLQKNHHKVTVVSQSLYTLYMVEKKQQCRKTCANHPPQCSVFRVVVRALMKYLNMYKGKQYIKVGNLLCLPNSMEKATTRKVFDFDVCIWEGYSKN